jgi:predicted anti-sigma-YlaC factor YlaD
METILQETPEHEGLLVSAATGFVSYAEMWVLRPARYAEDTDLQASRAGRARAKKLFLRARDYAGRALEVRHPGIEDRLLRDPETAAQELGREDLAAMYWFAAAHGRAITTDLSDADLMVTGLTVTAILDRGLELDESWNRGAFHEMWMSVPQQLGGSDEKAEMHFAKVMEFNDGMSIGPLVSLAEIVHLKRQDQGEFTRTLEEVLAFDPDLHPDTRLTNILAQEHAEWLLARTDRLFWMDGSRPESEPNQRRKKLRRAP